MSLTYAAQQHRRPDPPAGVWRCPEPDPDCGCHDHTAAVPQPAEITREAGQPLDPGTRRSMEGKFGHDFGQVRVHADERAAASAHGIDALAYSSGPHLAFGAGQYAPGTLAGQRLIAHELAHVVQQDGSTVDGALRAPAHGHSESALEDDAQHAASAVVNGRAPAVRHRGVTGMTLRAPAPTGPVADATTAPPESAPPRRPDVETGKDMGRHGKLDAELNRPGGLLTVAMKVKFVRNDRPTPWPSAARFEQFKTDFIRTVTRRWSFRHFLVPAEKGTGEPAKVAVRVQVIPVTSGEHATANVSYSDDRPTSSVSRDRSRATLDQLDTEERPDIPQTPAQHEFGHLLGLDHISCRGGEEDKCYGRTPEQRADVMGEGSFVSPRDYEVFAEIIRDLTGREWRVQQASFIPTSRGPEIGGAIGALVGGLGAGAIGAAIGSLAGPGGAVLGAFIGAAVGIVGGYFAGRELGTPRVPS